MIVQTFSGKQKKSIRKICQDQKEVFRDLISESNIKDTVEELKANGVDITEYDYVIKLNKYIKAYQFIESNPNKLFIYLNENMMRGFKTALLNGKSHKKPHIRNIWKKIFMSEELLTQLN